MTTTKTKNNNGLNCPLFILDVNFMEDILNGRAINNKLFTEIIRRKTDGLPFQVITNQASFNRALYLANPKHQLQNVKFILDITNKIYPSNANFKNAVDVKKEFDKFVKLMSEGGI